MIIIIIIIVIIMSPASLPGIVPRPSASQAAGNE